MEQDIRTRTGMPDLMFWRYRHELIRLHGTFRRYDEDADGFVTLCEARVLLKHLGFEPYRQGQQRHAAEALLEDSDANHDGLLDLFDFLRLMERVRSAQRAQRQASLREAFQAHGTRRVDFSEARGLLSASGVRLEAPEDEEAVQLMLEEFDTECNGEATLAELEDFAQRAHEMLRWRAAERKMEEARVLGIDLAGFTQCQMAFDQLDARGTGSLAPVEVQEALQMQLGIDIIPAELQLLFKELGMRADSEAGMLDFLRLTKLASQTLLEASTDSFRLENIPPDRLRDCLLCFPLDERYIQELPEGDLPELLARYLDMDLGADLAIVLPEVQNEKQLLDYAKLKAQRERDAEGKPGWGLL